MVDGTGFTGRISATVALALLESLREVDMPVDRDALHETDLPLNLQRRLGLSSVIGDQIRRYERRRGEALPAAEVASLFALIGRREDAARIFVEAGQRIARDDLEERRVAARIGLRLLPQSLRERRALGRVRRIARAVSPEAEIHLEHKPHALIVEHGLPARAADGGVGCALLDGAIQYVFAEYRASGFRVIHRRCEGRSEDCCEWLLESANGGGGAVSIETAERSGGVEGRPGGPDEGAGAPDPAQDAGPGEAGASVLDPHAGDADPRGRDLDSDPPGSGSAAAGNDPRGGEPRTASAAEASDLESRHPEAAPGG